ncbi:Hypothetical predicted protein, partial [Pelobates cultripes]
MGPVQGNQETRFDSAIAETVIPKYQQTEKPAIRPWDQHKRRKLVSVSVMNTLGGKRPSLSKLI